MRIFKSLMLLVLMLGNVVVHAKTFNINQHNFEIKITKGEDRFGFEQESFELYRASQKLLSHTKHLSTGNGSISSIEIGDYDIKGNQLIFYTYWASGDTQGLWAYPYGVRKQIYTINAKGGVDLTTAVIYAEVFNSEGSPEEVDAEKEYLQFLHTAPKDQQQRQALDHYIQSVQTHSKARFVNGKERAQLIQEVEGRLASQIKIETNGWKERFLEGEPNKIKGLKFLRMGQQL